jgi:3-oxoacyl-[acyl-carrier protein] reductase
MEISFKGQTVLITGGTRGIGLALAKLVLELGGHCIITGTHNSDKWQESSNFIDDENLDYIQIDFASENLEGQIEEKISKQYSKIDVCINNAGINKLDDISEVPEATLSKIMKVNLLAPALVTSKVSLLMKKNNYGKIVNISSVFGLISKAGRSSYSATKAGLIGQTKAVALDLAGDGILVNAVCPGFIDTELTRSILGDSGIKKIIERIPLGRLAKAEELVPTILFLASGLNSYITGSVVTIDGGVSAS